MSTGLRKRLASFKPLTASPVSDLHVLHTEKSDDNDEHVEVVDVHEEDACRESLSRSYSSISSRSSEDHSEHEHEHGVNDAANDAGNDTFVAPAQDESSPKSAQSSKPKFAHRNLPRLSTKSPRNTLRSGTSDVKYNRGDTTTSSASWLGYDLSIIVALVSPIGNMLTGSDHFKNVLILFFLIYYLHQLVEVPWSLYRMSIPGEPFTPTAESDPTKLKAYSELRSLEIFYLVLTVVSPFIGATLLRITASAISGDPTTLSWFSTLLFVLATGVRPWTHLTERLKNRSRALKELIDESDADEQALLEEEDSKVEINREISDLRGKFDLLDKRLVNLDVSSSREWDDLADAIDAIEASVVKHQNEANKKAQDADARLGVLETYVLDLHRKDRQTHIHSKDSYMRGARLRTLFWEVLALPWTVSVFMWAFATTVPKRILQVSAPSPAGVEKLLTPPNSNSSLHSHVLETIIEEETETQDNPPQKKVVPSDSTQTLVAEGVTNPGDISVVLLLAVSRLVELAFSPLLFLTRLATLLVVSPRSVVRAIVH